MTTLIKNKLINKRMHFFFFLAFLLLSLVFSASAEDLCNAGEKSFELLDRDYGLSNLSVSAIIQDRDGFIWFATQSGLNRYDGREMKVYRNNPFSDDELIHNLIQTMYYDSENNEIWIGTYQGLSNYKIDDNVFVNYTVEEDGLSNPVIVAITKDLAGDIWIGTLEGLNRLDPQTGEIEQYDIPQGVVRSLKIDSTGKLWIGGYAGLMYYDTEDDAINLFEVDLPSPFVMVVNEFEPGVLSLGLWDGGIADVVIDTKEVTSQQFSDNRVYSYIKADCGCKWVGTWGGGLFIVHSNGIIESFSGDQADSLAHPVVYSLLQDSSGIVWVGTNGGGVYKVNPRRYNYLGLMHNPEDKNSLNNGKINKIFIDSKGYFWFSIYNNGVDRYNPVDGSIIHYNIKENNPQSLPLDLIVDMVELENGKLLMGSSDGLIYFDLDSETFSRWELLPEGSLVYSIEQVSESQFWIGTYENGAYYIDTARDEVINYNLGNEGKNKLSNNLVYSILYDSKQRVWIGTNDGLNLLEAGADSFTVFKRVPGDYWQLASDTIKIIYEDSQSRIWVGLVGGGLACYNEDGTFTAYTEIDGLSSNTVSGILEGRDGRIWASTIDGISIVAPESNEIFTLTPEDGIGGWEFNTGHARDEQGFMYFGGIHGITAIPDDFSSSQSEAPRVYITDVTLFQESIDPNRVHFNDAEFEFEASDSFLSFKFVALDYDAPEKVNFEYKLEGFDHDWVKAGTNDFASYSNLPPGDYELRVLAKTVKNIQSEEVSLHFTIAKPAYLTIPAFILYGILLFIFLYGAYRALTARSIAKRNNELAEINKKLETANNDLILEAERRRIAEEAKQRIEGHMRNQQKLESIGTLAGGVAHEINNPINGIMNYGQIILDSQSEDPIVRESAEEIIRETNRISIIVKNLLDFSRQNTEDYLEASVEDMVGQTLSLIRTIIRQDQIALDVNIEENLPVIKCRSQQIQQVLMNLITNARDALNDRYSGYHENKRIIVSCQRSQHDGKEFVRFTVTDFGNGIPLQIQDKVFDPFYTTKDRSSGTGLGLSISYGIIQEHGGQLTFETEEGKFTSFSFELPLTSEK